MLHLRKYFIILWMMNYGYDINQVIFGSKFLNIMKKRKPILRLMKMGRSGADLEIYAGLQI